MESIQTIEQLVESLNNAKPEDYSRVINRVDIPVKEFRKYSYWNQDKYTRNCLQVTDEFELILLCWSKDTGSPIHGHAGQRCWVYQVEGNVEEIRYKKSETGRLVETYRHDLNPGSLSYMDDSMGYHVIQNKDDRPAMTLHIYIAPITACKVLKPDADAFETVALKYDNEYQVIED